jgi:hypothetical protein
MRCHCDACGRELDSKRAILRSWEGEVFRFCSDACARSGIHLADDVYRDDDTGAGPLAPGELDDAPSRERQKAG